MERELALEVVRVTEFSALAAAGWMGRGDKAQADRTAAEAMRTMLDTVSIQGTLVNGEGAMNEASLLYIGEQLGSGAGPEVDVAVDPLEGTELVAKGLNNALAVLAIANKGSLLRVPNIYMEKLAVGPELKGQLNLDDALEATLKKASQILNKSFSDLTIMALDRIRHEGLIRNLRELGVRIKLISDGDVSGAIAPAFVESGIDLYLGSGGAAEGVLAAAALQCLGGEIQGRLLPSNEREHERCLKLGISNPTKLLSMQDMVGNEDVIFAATGITPGEFLQGVTFLPDQRAETHSFVMRSKTKTIRYIKTSHYLPQKSQLILPS